MLSASTSSCLSLNYLVFLKFYDNWTEFTNECRAEDLNTCSFTQEMYIIEPELVETCLAAQVLWR